nr:Abi family protein [uncultured Acetatifactor sp.]
MISWRCASLKAKISLHFHAVSEKELAQYLKTLTHFRNVCAHNERLFSFR